LALGADRLVFESTEFKVVTKSVTDRLQELD